MSGREATCKRCLHNGPGPRLELPPNSDVLGELHQLFEQWKLAVLAGNHDRRSLEALRDDLRKSIETWL